MESRKLIKINLGQAREAVLALIEDMKEAPVTSPTPNGGCHPLWVLGHLTYSEEEILREMMLGEPHPIAQWKEIFNTGTEVVADASKYPPFDEVMERCRETGKETLALLDSFSEEDLDRTSKNTPEGYEELFGTYRHCFLMVANHWWMHRAHVSDARRAAGRERIGP